MDLLEFPNNKISRLQRQKRRDKRLGEELIECGRYAGGNSNKKVRQKGKRIRRQRMDYYNLHPAHEPINLKHTTLFEDNLEPLERFLRSNVGRPWSEVYSKLNQHLDRSTVPGEHVFQHLKEYMGKPIWGRQTPVENPQYRTQNDGTSTRFGVHPTSGQLCIVNPRNPLPKGPFPKQARFKKAKQRRKLKLRLGLEQKSRKQKQLPDMKVWFEQVIIQQEGLFNDLKWLEFLHQNIGFWKDEFYITLRLDKIDWVRYQKQTREIHYMSGIYTKLNGRIWLNHKRVDKPKQIVFECFWCEHHKVMLDWFEA